MGKGKKYIMAAKNNKTQSNTKTSVQSKAGLLLSTSRIKRILKNNRCAERYSPKAIIYLTAAMEYVIGELLEVSSLKTQEAKKSTISNRHVYLGAKADKELFNVVLGNGAHIRDAGFASENPLPVSAKKSKRASQKKE